MSLVGQVLVWIDAQTSMRQVVACSRAANAEFVVLHDGAALYAFRPRELALFEHSDAPARTALRLGPANASRRGGLNPNPPRIMRSYTQSERRTVYVDATGRPTRVVDPGSNVTSGHKRSVEGTSITRYPSIDAELAVAPDTRVDLIIDLEPRPAQARSADPIQFDGLPEKWKDFWVTVQVTSPQLELAGGDGEGTIRVRRDQPSVKCRLVAHRKAGVTEPIEVTATFFHDDRCCGVAHRTFAAAAPSLTAGALAIPPGGQAADLTVLIHRLKGDRRRLIWSFVPATVHRRHVQRAVAETLLEDDPGPYVRGLFRAAAASKPGGHAALLHGIGQHLWELAPRELHDAYWMMRGALGDGFTIQFITDEPYIPWELMRPVKAGEVTRLIAETHPVARGFLEHPDRMRPVLPIYGEILTMAPDYTRRAPPGLPPLVAAGQESAMLQAKFGARAITPASTKRIIDVLADRGGTAVRILHFAGHGRVETPIVNSCLACEDGDVRILQVRRQETRLGETYQTFVILNACEVGAAGDVLGEVGGWAEAFAFCNFSGFIAPLWAVFDDHAKLAMETFFEAILVRGKPVGEALRDVRATYGEFSPTFMSYVYYGDVNARFG